MTLTSFPLADSHPDLTFGDPIRGQALPQPVRVRLEQAFDIDLGAVRIHEGTLANSLGANAVVHGTDIHFAPGRYAPESEDGMWLLAHETAHIAQQMRGDTAHCLADKDRAVCLVHDTELEAEADLLADCVVAGQTPATVQGTSTQVNWSVLLPNLYIEINGKATKLTNTNSAMMNVGTAVTGTQAFGDYSDNYDTIKEILHSWVNSSRNTIKRFIFGYTENTRYYMSWENMAKALIGEAKSLGNLKKENDLAKAAMESSYINWHLNKYLERKVYAKVMNAAKNGNKAEIALRQKKNTYKGEYAKWYGSTMGKVMMYPERHTFYNKVAVIHDLNKVFRSLGENYWKVPKNKTAMTALVPNNDGTYKATQLVGLGTGGFRRGQPPKSIGNNKACTLLEDSHVVSAARINNMPIEMGPSFTTGRMLQAGFACGASKPELTAISWGIFAFWNLQYAQKFSRVHRFHGTMDIAKNYGVDYTPFSYPSSPPDW